MSPELLAYVMVVYLLAGAVKGVVGFGMPIVSLAMLAPVLGLKEAIILMLVPSLVTNIWQGLTGGQLMALIRRLWLMLAMACIAIWFATGILVSVDGGGLAAILGGVLILYSGYSLATPQIPGPGRHEIWMSPIIGFVAGLSMGMTGTFVVPGTVYLQALRLGKDGVVQALGLSFLVTTLVLAGALGQRGALPMELAILSAAAVIPSMIGMVLGQRIRGRLPEDLFRRIFFIALLIVGGWLMIRPMLL